MSCGVNPARVLLVMNIFSKHETRRRLLRGLPDTDMLQLLIGQWFQSPQGSEVWRTELQHVEPIISRLFGYHILQIGCHEEYSLIESSPVGHKILFSPAWRSGNQQAVADNEELPLGNDSMDVVVLHHALDFAEDSHRLLREATRVLRPGGQMLIVGFNPISYWGLWRLFGRRVNIPWRGRFISRGRVTDWLQLLDLEISQVSYGLHFAPLKSSRLLKYAERFETLGSRMASPFGGAYFIRCIKQVATVTPIMPRWQAIPSRATVIPAAENVRAKKIH